MGKKKELELRAKLRFLIKKDMYNKSAGLHLRSSFGIYKDYECSTRKFILCFSINVHYSNL